MSNLGVLRCLLLGLRCPCSCSRLAVSLSPRSTSSRSWWECYIGTTVTLLQLLHCYIGTLVHWYNCYTGTIVTLSHGYTGGRVTISIGFKVWQHLVFSAFPGQWRELNEARVSHLKVKDNISRSFFTCARGSSGIRSSYHGDGYDIQPTLAARGLGLKAPDGRPGPSRDLTESREFWAKFGYW